MNRLQKRAWGELVGVVVCVIVAGIGIGVLVNANAQGIWYIVVTLVAGGTAGLVGSVYNFVMLKKYDERERKIYRQAFLISTYAFVGYIVGFVFIAFFSVGGKGVISVSVLPAMMLGGLFIGQAVQSGVILIRCAMEEADGA